MFVNRYRIQKCHVRVQIRQIWKELIVEDVFMDRIQRCHVCE